MDRGPWGDPAVESGFAAAYVPLQEQTVRVDDAPQRTAQDEADEAADLAARPVLPNGRRVRAPQPARLSPQRAVAGAAVSVAGVLLGIGTLLWLSDDPSDGAGPVVQAPPPAAQEIAPQPEVVTAPVDPVEVPAPAVPPAAPPVAAAPAEVPVVVLNNSRIEDLADTAAAVFRRGGWPVARTGNFRGRIPSTTVYYEPGQEAAARAFAARFDEVVRVRPRFATLPARGLVVVVTRDFRG